MEPPGEGLVLSLDKSDLDRGMIHSFISERSYWGPGRTREDMDNAIDNSAYCFGVFDKSGGGFKQVAFARLISDRTTIGYLADFFVLEEYRGKGIGKWLMRSIVDHPEVKALKVVLFTNTPDFYVDTGFVTPDPGATPVMMRGRPV